MASKLIKLTDSNGNLLIPAVVSQAVQVKNGTTPVDLQTAYEGIQSAISGISLAQAVGFEELLSYNSYISQPATNQISYYFVNGDDEKIKTNTFTINNVEHASNADEATNASKLTTGKLTYNGSNGTLTYNFGDGDKNVSILGTTSAYGFVKLGTGAGHAATGNHTHTISYNGNAATITAGGNTSSAIKASSTTYGFVKLDEKPLNGSTNVVPSTYIYNSYQYVKEQLANKAASDHTHSFYGSNVNYTGDAGNSVNVMIGFKDTTINTSTPGSSPVAMSYYSYSVPTKKYIDDNFVTQSEFETFSASGMHYIGKTGTGTTFNPTNPKQGDVYIVGKAGHGVNDSEVGDFIVYNGSSWDIWDKNVNGALYKGSNALITNNIIAAADANGLVKTVTVLPGDIDIDTATGGAELSFFDNNASFDGSLEERSRVNFIGENGITVSVDKTNINPGSVYRGAIQISSSHTGSGNAGKITYWKSETEHSSITSTYGSNNSDNIQLHWIDNGVLKNVSVGAGDSEIPTYVDSSGHIKPVTFINHHLLPAEVFENSAKAKFASKVGNTIYTYISPTGNSDTTNGSVLQFVQGSNVTITRNGDDQITIAAADTANHIFDNNSTPTDHSGANAVNPYLKIWGASNGAALQFTGSQGIKVESITVGSKPGYGLQISHTFSDAAVVTAADLTHTTYYYEATNVTVDDFSLYTFDNTKKYLEGISTTNTTHAYIKGS